MLNMQKKMSTAFYALLSLPATAMGFGLSVQISALSWILNTKYGLDIHEIGIVWAAGPIAGIIAQPIVGALSDKLWFMGGRRRPWIILGGLLTGLMLLALPNLGIIQKVFGVSGSEGLLAIAVVVALTLDLSINVSFNPTRSLIADCTNHSQRSKGYTWMQTVSGTFGVLAYLIAVIWGNEVLIYVGVAIALLFTIVPMIFIEEPRYLENEEPAAKTESQNTAKKKTSVKDFNFGLRRIRHNSQTVRVGRHFEREHLRSFQPEYGGVGLRHYRISGNSDGSRQRAQSRQQHAPVPESIAFAFVHMVGRANHEHIHVLLRFHRHHRAYRRVHASGQLMGVPRPRLGRGDSSCFGPQRFGKKTRHDTYPYLLHIAYGFGLCGNICLRS